MDLDRTPDNLIRSADPFPFVVNPTSVSSVISVVQYSSRLNLKLPFRKVRIGARERLFQSLYVRRIVSRVGPACPSHRTGATLRIRGSSSAVTPSSWYFCSSASSTARALVPVFRKNIALAHVLTRSRRVSGGWSKATWQIRSKGSRFLPTSSARGSSNKPSLFSSSMMASLRSALFHWRQKSLRLAKWLRKVFFV